MKKEIYFLEDINQKDDENKTEKAEGN